MPINFFLLQKFIIYNEFIYTLLKSPWRKEERRRMEPENRFKVPLSIKWFVKGKVFVTLQNSDAFVLRYRQRQKRAGIITETKCPYTLTNEVGLSKCYFRRETDQLSNSCVYVCILLLLLLFCCSVMSDSLRPHGLQHTRLPCPSPTPRVYSNSCPWSRWCHLILCHPPSPPALSLSQHHVCMCECLCTVIQESIMYHSKTSCLVCLWKWKWSHSLMSNSLRPSAT